MSRRKKVLAFTFLIIGMILGHNYYKGPLYTLDLYRQALIGKEYHTIYRLLSHQDQVQYTEEQVSTYFKKIYEIDNQLIAIKKNVFETVKFQSFFQDSSIYTLKYEYENRRNKQPIQMVYEKGKWKVKLPFTTHKLCIHAPSNVHIYIDNKRLVCNSEGVYIAKDLFPGEYTLKVLVPQMLEASIHTMIQVPKISEIILPYETADVVVTTNPNSIITLGEQKQYNEAGSVVFKNILKGIYPLKIYDKYGFLQPNYQKISIDQDKLVIQKPLKQLSLAGKKKWDIFLEKFYKVYKQAIEEKNPNLLEDYIKADKKDVILREFSSWYIDNKNVKNVSIHFESGVIKQVEKGNFSCNIVENIKLVNTDTTKHQITYRVTLEWNTTIGIGENGWEILDRKLKQSMVSYLDEQGRWVQY